MEYSMEELLPLVTKLTDKFTSKESTSVTYETAARLMGAVVYCIGQGLKDSAAEEGGGRQDLVLAGKGIPAAEAYRLGYGLVVNQTKKTNELYQSIISDFCDYGNLAYSDTIRKGMPEFFRRYDAVFCPQDHLLTLDYPTIWQVTGYTGIDAISHYLTYIRMEQQVLQKFPQEYVRALLREENGDYKYAIINICRVVIRNVLGCMIAGKPIEERGYSGEQCKIIEEYLGDNSRQTIQDKLTALLHIFISKSYEGDADLFGYLQTDMQDFAVELKNAVDHNALHVIFR